MNRLEAVGRANMNVVWVWIVEACNLIVILCTWLMKMMGGGLSREQVVPGLADTHWKLQSNSKVPNPQKLKMVFYKDDHLQIIEWAQRGEYNLASWSSRNVTCSTCDPFVWQCLSYGWELNKTYMYQVHRLYRHVSKEIQNNFNEEIQKLYLRSTKSGWLNLLKYCWIK